MMIGIHEVGSERLGNLNSVCAKNGEYMIPRYLRGKLLSNSLVRAMAVFASAFPPKDDVGGVWGV